MCAPVWSAPTRWAPLAALPGALAAAADESAVAAAAWLSGEEERVRFSTLGSFLHGRGGRPWACSRVRVRIALRAAGPGRTRRRWQPHHREQIGPGEAGDAGDPLALDGEHHDAVGLAVRVRGQGRLPVGARRHELDPVEPALQRLRGEELADRRWPG